MSKINAKRPACQDVFKAFLVEHASYAGHYELPCIVGTNDIPKQLVSFSKCISNNNYNQWVHTYEDDVNFERLWRNPKRYLNILAKYDGVILPDFSLYRDMPLVMQMWNIYRSRAIGAWLESEGVKVICNIRWGDKRMLELCCTGVKKHMTIAIGSYGTLKNKIDRKIFIDGLDYVIHNLQPSALVIYGSLPADIFTKYQIQGIQIITFKSDFALSRGEK